MRILVIEDERGGANSIRRALKEERSAVDQAFDGVMGAIYFVENKKA